MKFVKDSLLYDRQNICEPLTLDTELIHPGLAIESRPIIVAAGAESPNAAVSMITISLYCVHLARQNGVKGALALVQIAQSTQPCLSANF